MVDVADIKIVAEQIGKEFHPERVILFGSYAYGNPNPDSDVDLLVILKHQAKNWELAADIRDRISQSFPIDILVRSPEELQERLGLGDPFIIEIVSSQKVGERSRKIRRYPKMRLAGKLTRL